MYLHKPGNEAMCFSGFATTTDWFDPAEMDGFYTPQVDSDFKLNQSIKHQLVPDRVKTTT